ncbi:MAG: glycosyltransferase family 2 protein, partial [Rickettsiales bacterium]|nr:glycosyltransferase family 2 protein [Rickettsiales bacterium]
MPEISLIFINYNNEKYLKDALDSVLNQTFHNYECIVVDDGSTDRSVRIIKEYCRKDKRLKLIVQQNSGCQAARNMAYSVAVGEFIMFMDSDDCMVPNAMDILYSARKKYAADVTYGTCCYAPDSYKYRPVPGNSDPRKLFYGHKDKWHELFLLDNSKFRICWCWLCIFPRQLLADVKWNSQIPKNSDLAFMVDVLARSNTVVVVDSIVSIHRDSTDSISNLSQGPQSVKWLPGILKYSKKSISIIGGKFEKEFYKMIMQ